MCGIAGLWATDGDISRLDGAIGAIAHRGPDARGSYTDATAGVALGHTRLAIIDLSPAGAQPMLHDDGMVALVFNGEIYNYMDLRAPLVDAGVNFRGHSDTEVLLHLYLRDGREMLPKLNGIFALAIYDKRKGELLLARDALGVKPIYFTQSTRGFAFASEIKALRELVSDLGDVDAAGLNQYLTHLWSPGPSTMLDNVQKLGPGEWMLVASGHFVEKQRWHTPAPMRLRAMAMTAEAASNAVRDALRRAVHRQMVADVPVGAFLSGGLDSSAVVAFAREQVPEIRCSTIATTGGRDPGEADDLPYAKRVAKHLNVKLDVVHVDAARMAGDVERMVWQLDEPLADPAPLNVLYIAQLARESGIKVLLSGAGGDDLFTGYRRHVAVQHEWLWSWLPRDVRVGLESLTSRLDQRSGIGRRLGRLFAGAGKSGDERLAAYFAWATPETLLPLFSADIRARLKGTRADQPMLEYLHELPGTLSPLARMLALEQRFFLPDHNLLYTDKMSMAVGVETRVPFLDLDLVDLAATIPDALKQRGTTGKWVLKKAMEPLLPHDVIYRPKTGFGAPLRRWMRNELREMLNDLLSPVSLKRRGLFDRAAVQKLIEDNEAGRRDGAYILFSLLCIEIWCRRFMDVRPETADHYGN